MISFSDQSICPTIPPLKRGPKPIKAFTLPDGNHLTPAELQVARLLCLGHSLKQVAYLTRNSPRTIDRHRQSLHQKLHCHTILGLLAQAFRHGIISPNEFTQYTVS